MSPLFTTLLMLIAFAAFGWLAARKLAIVASLQPEARSDHPLQRLKAVAVNGFLQSQMIRGEWRPGLMHATIFLGFLSLLLRKLQLLAIGYDESATLPGIAGGLFAGFKDADRAGRARRLRLRAPSALGARSRAGWSEIARRS